MSSSGEGDYVGVFLQVTCTAASAVAFMDGHLLPNEWQPAFATQPTQQNLHCFRECFRTFTWTVKCQVNLVIQNVKQCSNRACAHVIHISSDAGPSTYDGLINCPIHHYIPQTIVTGITDDGTFQTLQAKEYAQQLQRWRRLACMAFVGVLIECSRSRCRLR